jgi:catechol 2,3-dioxygenase-like lactoylglutathione lyase family enzyme
MQFHHLKSFSCFLTGFFIVSFCAQPLANDSPSNTLGSKIAVNSGGDSKVKEDIFSMDSRLSIVTLGVADLVDSVAFYREGLGLELKEEMSNNYIAFFQLNGILLALYPSELLAKDAGVPHEKSSFSGITLAQNVASKTDVDKLLELASSAGATITKQGEVKEWGGYSGYFQDLNGYLWEIAWNPYLVIDKNT